MEIRTLKILLGYFCHFLPCSMAFNISIIMYRHPFHHTEFLIQLLTIFNVIPLPLLMTSK